MAICIKRANKKNDKIIMDNKPKCSVCNDKGYLKKDYQYCSCKAGKKVLKYVQKCKKIKGFVY